MTFTRGHRALAPRPPHASAARRAVLVACSLVVVACNQAEGPVDGIGDDAGRPEIDAEPPRPRDACFPVLCEGLGHVCRGGNVVATVPVMVPCRTSPEACPDGEIVEVCELGCEEGAFVTSSARDLCRESTTRPRPGDACESDADCTPSVPHTELECVVDQCLQRTSEVCDGVLDEDRDDLVDEGCTCTPAVLTSIERPGGELFEARFAGGRIALRSTTYDDSMPSATVDVHVLGADGETSFVYSSSSTERSAQRVEAIGDELVVIEREIATGAWTLVRLRESGDHERVALRLAPPGDRPFVTGDERGWTMFSHLNERVAMTRHAPDGTRIAARRAEEVHQLDVAVSVGPRVIIGYRDSTGLARIASVDDDLALTPIVFAGDTTEAMDAVRLGDEVLVLVNERDASPRLFRVDVEGTLVDARWVTPPRRPIMHARIAADPATGAVAIAFESLMTIDVARYADASLAAPEVPVQLDTSGRDARPALGFVDGALRMVAGTAGWTGTPVWRLVAPCP